MRPLLLAPFALLAACSGTEAASNLQGNGAAAPPPGEPDNRIDCRPAGAAAFERACTVDSAESPRGRVLTIRKADGGFRRLLIGRDGRISAADGAEAAHVVTTGSAGTQVEIGGDRFRLPAGPR
ncbi:hypothetical protein [Allosphingosinicella sp.]|uniref:hypothetical protein n=1 Tax=Allosphingosinicella sp. TaxID=2823234 RepID=UPI00378322BF